MTHKDCGGEVEARYDLPAYRWEDGSFASWPYFCKKCGEEILGDASIIIEGWEE